MMNERTDHMPLTDQERFIVNNVSTGLSQEELSQRVNNSDLFPPDFDQKALGAVTGGLLERGLIRETSDQGLAVRPPAPVARPYPRRAEPLSKESPRPAPLPRFALSGSRP